MSILDRNGSPFTVRGVVEGYYGRPWTPEQRLELVEFIAARGMNTFVYAPKDDPLVRRDWRLPYTGEALTGIAALVGRCRADAVDFVYCLSPGLSIRYSSDDDLAALVAKSGSVAAFGVKRFGLLLDDIPIDLQHHADIDAFGGLVEAHISLIGRFYERLPTGSELIVCPTVYRGYGDEDYITRLGRGIDPRIELFWTGRAICSATIDLIDAATFARATGRPATYWDNYPVNDVAMGHELHVGPYRGRDRHLWRFATGVVANGMEHFESSKIAFATIADYLRSPEDYDPESSWRAALADVVGAADLEPFALFADNVRSSCLSADDAPIVTNALERFAFARQEGRTTEAAEELAILADRLTAAADHLLRGPVANRPLLGEARPWIESFETGAQALSCIARLAAIDRLDSDGPAELQPYLDRLRRSRVRVFGDTMDMTLAELTAGDRTPAGHPSIDHPSPSAHQGGDSA